MTEIRDSSDVEILRLQVLTLAQATRIRELEDALAECMRRGVRLREVLRYGDDTKPRDRDRRRL